MISKSYNHKSDTTPAHRAVREAAVLDVFCTIHPLAVLRPRLRRDGLVAARDLRKLPAGRLVKICGLRIIVHMPPTKSGKRVIFVTLEDETGLIDLAVFPKAQEQAAGPILSNKVIAVQGRLQREGKGGRSISIVVDRVIGRWSGRIIDLLSYRS